MSQPANDDDEDTLVQLACHAALHNDIAGLCKALGIPNSNASSSLRSPLLTTPNAQILQDRLLTKFSSSTTSNDDALFRALLMVPPSYESPFAAALSFVTYVQSSNCERSRSSLRSSVTEIQSFLQQTVAAWWERERRFCSRSAESETPNFYANYNDNTSTTNNTANCWILKVVKQIVRPFISADDTTENGETNDKNKRRRDDDYWMIPLELITTILSILNGLDRALDQDILDAVFQLPTKNNVRRDRLLPWLSLATELHTFLRPIDWKVLLESLKQKHDNQFDKQDLPGLMTSVLSLATTTLFACDSSGGGKETLSGKRERFVALRQIALGLFHAASVDPGTFSTVTAVFQGAGTGHSGGASFGDWLDIIEEKEDCDNDIPRWVKANMVLALLGGTGKSTSAMLDNLLSRALMHTKRQSIAAIDGWRALLRLASSEYKVQGTKSSKGISSWIDGVERVFKGASYVGGGCFQCANGQPDVLLNQMGRLVYQSLFLVPDGSEVGASFKRTQAVHIVQRAQDWIHAANNRIRAEEGTIGVQEVAMVGVAFVVVFCELPLSQSFVVRGMAQALAGETDCPHSKTDIALLNCLIISTIVKHQPERRPEVWKPIVDIIAAGKLAKRVFFSIVQTIARTSENAQAAILSISTKYIQSPIHSVSWGLQSLDESCDRVQCSLFSFCVLINSPSWNESATEAWKILSDVIVANRPPLPVVARTWLFDLLEDVLETWETSPGVTDRLFRACLMRMLSFVEGNKALNKICISPWKLFTVWGCADALSVHVREDLPGLLKLASNLFFLTGEREGKIEVHQTFARLRFAMLRCCYPAVSTAPPALIQFGDTDDADNDAHRLIYCKLLLSLMISTANFALRGATNESTDVSSSQEELCDFDVDCLRSQLMSLEMKSTHAVQDRPQWLSERVVDNNQIGAKTPALPHDALESLACELCDSIAVFMGDHRWSFLTSNEDCPYLSSPREGLVLSLHGLYKAKRALSRNASFGYGWKNRFSSNSKHAHNVVSDIGTLLLDSAVFIDFNMTSNGRLSETVDVLGMLVNHVESLKKFLDEDIMHHQYFELDLSPILFGLWQLYSMVCSECASIRLIAYLENMTAECDLPDSGLFESQFQSAADIDGRIRHLRHSVLNAYVQSLHAVLKHGSAAKLFTLSHNLEFGGESPQNTVGYKSFRWSTNASTKPDQFLMECVRNLADDLVVGLQGQSGGVSTDMYTAFIESLDAISKLLVSLVKEKQVEDSTLCSLSFMCYDIATNLRDMFCSFPPQKKSLFCKALLVIAEAMPVLARCASRAALIVTDSGDEMEPDCPEKTGSDYENFAVASFTQCVGVLESWIGVGGELSWTTLKVPDAPEIDSSPQRDKESRKDGTSTDASGSVRSPEPLSRTNGVPTVVTITLERTPDATQGSIKNASMLLPLNSKDMWSWACSGALVALERVWIESIELLRRQEGQKLHLPMTSMWSHIYRRTSEFSGIISALSLALSEHANNQPSKHGSDKASTPRYLVEAFPVGSKLMLCSLAIRIVTATDAALRLIDYFVRLPESVPKLHGFVEALSIALVWLTSDEQSNSFDYVVCLRNWCTEERGESRESNHCRSEEEKVRKLFSKLVFRIERLESGLHKLNDLFLDSKALASKEATMARIEAIDKLTDLLIARGVKGPKGKSPFRNLVGRKAKGLVKGELEARNKRAADPRSGGAGDSKRRRSTARQNLRRRPIRSRNQTVDKWLRNDQQLENDGHEQDAFLDLEDFIADG